MPNASLVLTTIFDPVVLEAYYRNFERFGRLDRVRVILIPDRKTPPETYERCGQLRKRGLNVVCPGLDEQEAFLERIGLKPHHVPYDSDNRRNAGYLMALESGSDFLISIDDDNYCLDDSDYFAQHAVVLEGPREADIAASETGFVNACELLSFTPQAPVYPRGFPYSARFKPGMRTAPGAADVTINEGLWLRDPDVDAITCLQLRPQVTGFRGRSIVLDHDAWCPVNTQNTALRQDLIPSYYFIRMGYTVNGAPVGRYGDIFSGYFAQACAKHLGGAVRFGTPIADHRRNSHNYMNDATAEWPAIGVIEDFIPWLTTASLHGSTCVETYASLAAAIGEAAETFQGTAWSGGARGFLHQMAHYMRIWLAGCHAILGCGAVHS